MYNTRLKYFPIVSENLWGWPLLAETRKVFYVFLRYIDGTSIYFDDLYTRERYWTRTVSCKHKVSNWEFLKPSLSDDSRF
jgi:hypothetical protein